MSERIHFSLGGEEMDANPENTALFRYSKVGALGVRLAMYDHVFIGNQDEGKCYYVFIDQYGEEYVNDLTEAMIEDGYSVMLNLDTVSAKDIEAYDRIVLGPLTKDIEPGVPEEWL